MESVSGDTSSRLERGLIEGTAQHLDILEQRASTLLQRQTQHFTKRHSKRTLLQQISFAKSKLERLRLSRSANGTVGSRLLCASSKRLQKSTGCVDRGLQNGSSNAAAMLLHLNSVAYRLAGISVVTKPPTKHHPKLLLLRIDTAFKANYHERYYVVLREQDQLLRLFKHTLPHFLQLDQIVQRYLSSNPAEFAWSVQVRCNAFVSRRQQLNHLEDFLRQEWSSHCELSCTAAIDLISFEVELVDRNRYIDVRLVYEDIDWARPKQALVRWRDSREKLGLSQQYSWSRLRAVEKAFQAHELVEAARMLCSHTAS